MNLTVEYEKQHKCRNWVQYLQHLPDKSKATVLDLGSATGYISAILAQKYETVVAIENNPKLLNFAKEKVPKNVTLIQEDFFTKSFEEFRPIFGFWCSFSIAYTSNPHILLSNIYKNLEMGGWVVVIEIDAFLSRNLLSTSPFLDRVKSFELQSINSEYNHLFGRELKEHLINSSFIIETFDDQPIDLELSFKGPATDTVLRQWQARLERMKAIRQFLGDDYNNFCEDMLTGLKSPNHNSIGAVRFALGRKYSDQYA